MRQAWDLYSALAAIPNWGVPVYAALRSLSPEWKMSISQLRSDRLQPHLNEMMEVLSRFARTEQDESEFHNAATVIRSGPSSL